MGSHEQCNGLYLDLIAAIGECQIFSRTALCSDILLQSEPLLLPFALGSNAQWGGSRLLCTFIQSVSSRLSGKVTVADAAAASGRGRRHRSERYHRGLLALLGRRRRRVAAAGAGMRGGGAVAAVRPAVLLVDVHLEVVPRVGGVLAVGARHRVHLVQVHRPVVVLQVGRAAALEEMKE